MLNHVKLIIEQGESLRDSYRVRAAELREQALGLSESIRDILIAPEKSEI